ncbi:CPBP family intramembrane glutamic endopeptidase [Methanobrevibacter sp.]|uniref:CPBP family intramembrane glutamic endopeptidase n=1 Tax=Methanobrevibacter sp. TaxID=66852 RepID=UPI00386C472C
MSLFNEKLKEITLKEVLLLIIILFLIQYFLNQLNIVHIDSIWIYIFLIFYFIFKLRGEISAAKGDIGEVFKFSTLKVIFIVVILNIFFSYGMLYFSKFILDIFPHFNLFKSPAVLTGSLFATILISPISEEFIFRGVFLNRLKLIVPTTFAVLISSLFFASLHSYGAIFAAFVFAVCVAILYLKTENIFVVIFAHFLNNLIAETIMILDSNNILFTNVLAMGTMSILAVASFIILLISIIQQFKNLNSNDI